MRFNGKKRIAMSVLLGVGIMAGSVAVSQIGYAAEPLSLKVSSVNIEGVEDYKADLVRSLIPEMEKSEINVSKLSQEIQIVNDAKAYDVKADFKPTADGAYDLTIVVKDLNPNHFAVGVNNTGNKYTGDWRTSVAYTNTNFTNSGDTFSLAYATSPNHMSDVKQVAATYKWLLPRAGSNMYINYAYSDINMGNIFNLNDIEIAATGTSQSVGLHYQHNFKYDKARKQILDVGVDYKDYNTELETRFRGQRYAGDEQNIRETVLNVSYADMVRWKNQAFAYNVGYVQNLHGDQDAYDRYRNGSTNKNFKILKLGVNYQVRSDSDWIFGVRANGQFTNDDLIMTEQLGAGGATTVRGFKENAVRGDKGIVGSFEVYTPEIMPHQRFVLFYDMASLSNNSYYLTEKSRKLSSYGIGYRFFEKDGLSVSLDYAKVIDKDNINMSDYHRPWNLNVVYHF